MPAGEPLEEVSFYGVRRLVAMLSAVFTLMVDSLMLTFYKGKSGSKGSGIVEAVDCESPIGNEIVHVHAHRHGHGHGHGALMVDGKDDEESRLRRNRIIAQGRLFLVFGYIFCCNLD